MKAPTKPPSPEKPKDKASAAPRSPLRVAKTPPPKAVTPLPASAKPAPSRVMGLGDSDLMGAATAGSGSGGGGGGAGCDMVRLLQEGLRKNPRARASLMRAHSATVSAGRAPLVWSGDWVRTDGEEGGDRHSRPPRTGTRIRRRSMLALNETPATGVQSAAPGWLWEALA